MTEKENQAPQLKYPADWIQRLKSGRKITVLTAYDAMMAGLISSHVDAILVGDTLGMVVQGRSSTLPVSLDEIIYHCQLVRRGAPEAFIIGDMPFGSYQISIEDGIANGIRIIKETQVNAVKIEGAEPHVLEIIQRLHCAGVPVMGHAGLKPQSFMNTSGFKVQGQNENSQQIVLKEVLALQEAGCFAIVLELISSQLAQKITSQLEIPTIGIGAGVHTSGQVLVLQDLLGMETRFKPRHVKQYANLANTIQQAVKNYHADVHTGQFPAPENSFK